MTETTDTQFSVDDDVSVYVKDDVFEGRITFDNGGFYVTVDIGGHEIKCPRHTVSHSGNSL